MEVVTPLLPADRDEGGRWEKVRVTLDERDLKTGLPPAD
jgi:hypothetical protein